MGKANVTTRAKSSLRALNFFMADMQSGLGPFVGVFLLAHGWRNGSIGSVMTIGSIAGVLITAPAGAWVDSSRNKRWLVVISGLAAVFASAMILISQSFWPVALSQVATAIAGAAVGPAVMGITLGMYRQSGFNRELGINQAYNHGGNALGAALSGLLGWKFGLPAVLCLALAFGVISVVCVLAIPRNQIDDRSARGLRTTAGSKDNARGLSVLLTCKPLLALGITLAVFSLGNGAMLSLYGLAVVDAKQGDPAAFVAATIVIAQVTMVFASLLAMRFVGQTGLLARNPGFDAGAAHTRRDCASLDYRLGRLADANPRRHHLRTADGGGARARRPDPQRYGQNQRWPGSCPHGARSRRGAKSGDRRVDRPMVGLRHCLLDSRCLRGGLHRRLDPSRSNLDEVEDAGRGEASAYRQAEPILPGLEGLRKSRECYCGFPGSAFISGLMRSKGSGNTMVDDLPLLDMSASV
jgi:MFS family permease